MTEDASPHVLSDRLVPVIEAAAERIHYAEARRANYSVMAGALIAAGVTILTFAFGAIGIYWMRFGAGACSVCMILLGTYILYIFGRQTNRYPFTSATSTWKWFYRDALPNSKAFDLERFKAWRDQEKRVKKAYDDQLPDFKRRVSTITDDNINSDQDLQQLYVLHINEKYKNLYLTEIRYSFNRGLIGIFITTLLFTAVGLYAEHSYYELQRATFSENGCIRNVEYRRVSSPLSDTAEHSVRAKITNDRDQQVTITKLIARDEAQWVLPVDVTYFVDMPFAVGPHSTAWLSAAFKSSRKVSTSIFSVVLECK